jgi:hypothetical protein
MTPCEVVGAEDMDDETVYRHINARHKAEFGIDADMHYSDTTSESLIMTHRAFHRRVHEIGVPGQFNHEHVGAN